MLIASVTGIGEGVAVLTFAIRLVQSQSRVLVDRASVAAIYAPFLLVDPVAQLVLGQLKFIENRCQ